jgi:hypothetical protein
MVMYETIRACTATVPVRSGRELLPKYGVLVSSASPFSNFRRYHILSTFIAVSMNFLLYSKMVPWLLALISAPFHDAQQTGNKARRKLEHLAHLVGLSVSY